MAVWAPGTALVVVRLLPGWMRLKLPALSCNGAGKLWAAGRWTAAGLAAGGYTRKNTSRVAMESPWG